MGSGSLEQDARSRSGDLGRLKTEFLHVLDCHAPPIYRVPMKDAVKLAADLVRIPSVNPMGGVHDAGTGEARLSDYLSAFFEERGIPFERRETSPGRANVIASIRVPGSRTTVLFDAHQDTVPVDTMKIPPFSGDIHDGRLWGRGACDVKGGMAAMLFAAARLAAEKPGNAASLILACTVDEEYSFAGVRDFLEGPWSFGKPEFAIVAEPTRLEIVTSHKGLTRWNITTIGRSSHGATPRLGVNAIHSMARVLEALEEYAVLLEKRTTHPSLGCATLNVGIINGGTGVNIVPDSCQIQIDRRLLPGEEASAALADCRDFILSRLGKDFPAVFDPPWHSEPALETPLDSKAVRRAAAAAAYVLGGARTCGVAYGTDAATLSAGGIPSVVFGPGDIAQAHTDDEWIELEQIEKAAEAYYRLLSTGE